MNALTSLLAGLVFGFGLLNSGMTNPDRVLGFQVSVGDRDLLTVETSRGAQQTVSTAKYEVTGRGGKGRELLQRGQFTRVVPPVVETPPPLEDRSDTHTGG